MSPAWLLVLLTGVTAVALKAAGPMLLARRPLGPRAGRCLVLLAPALLAALVVTQAFTSGHRLVLDSRAPGMAVAALAIVLRAPLLVTVALAAATTAGLRLALG